MKPPLNSLRVRISLWLTAGLLGFGGQAIQAQDAPIPALFEAPAGLATAAAPQARSLLVPRRRRVAVDLTQLAKMKPGLPNRLRIPLFSGADYTAAFDTRTGADGEFTGWIGRLEGLPNSWVNATFNDKTLVLRLHDGKGGVYSVEPQADGSYAVAEAPRGLQGVCGTHIAPEEEKAAQERMAKSVAPRNPNGNTWVDVLILYTWSAVAQASGNVTDQGPVRARANHWINHANFVHERSGSQVRLRLVGLEVLEFDDFDQDLNAQLGRFSQLPEVGARRTALGADLVCLMPYGRANSGNTLGIAYRGGWASVTESTQDALVFTHEIGHNLGCVHEIGSEGTPNEGYNHGFSHTESWDTTILIFGTVTEKRVTTMYSGFNNDTRTDYFSSPSIQFEFTGNFCGGICVNVMRALGVADSADNVRYLREIRAERAVRSQPQFHVAPGADGTGTALNPENDLPEIYGEWFPNTEVNPSDTSTIRIRAGSYPDRIRITQKSRLENWGGGVAHVGP